METIKTEQVGKYRIDILPDYNPLNPRDDDNLTTMVCFHRRYDLGDENNYDSGSYNGWDEMMVDIIKTEDVAVILPLYLYDHSGITISTTPFSCPWDSGQIGFVFVSKEKVREEFRVKRISKKLVEKVKNITKAEVRVYDQYLTGSACGYHITNTDTNEEVDGCWGWFDVDLCLENALNKVESYKE